MSKPIASKTFNGFTAELFPNDDRPGVNCFISKGRVGSSLAKAMDFGTIGEADEPGGEIKISNGTLDLIEAWALQHGY